MPKQLELIGKSFGRWTVIESAGRLGGKTAWLCRCECGAEKVVRGSMLVRGKSQSCGCLAAEKSSERKLTHGKTNTRAFRIWGGMQTRCFNKNNKSYKYYGEKGVTVCERWLTFENFLADMGEPPSDEHSIDRFPDGEGKYEPGNCRWATPLQQMETRNTACGSRNGRAKFTDEQVREILEQYESGEASAEIARQRNVAGSTIDRIVGGKRKYLRGTKRQSQKTLFGEASNGR